MASGNVSRYDFPVFDKINSSDDPWASSRIDSAPRFFPVREGTSLQRNSLTRQRNSSPYSATGQYSERRYNHPVFDRAIRNGEAVDNSRKETCNLSKFDGTGSVYAWILQCQQFFYNHNISEDDKSSTAGSYLKGKALKWLESFMRSRFYWPSWKEFSEKLIDHFRIASYEVQYSEVCENEVQEAADLNSENQDAIDVFGDVLDHDFSTLQNHSTGSLNEESDEIDVEIEILNIDDDAVVFSGNDDEGTAGVGMKDVKWDIGSSLDKFNDIEGSDMCILGYKDRDFVQEHVQIKELKTLSLNGEVQSLKNCNKSSVVDVMVQGAEAENLPLSNVKEIGLGTNGKYGAAYGHDVEEVKRVQPEYSYVECDDLLARLSFDKTIMESALLVKDGVLWDFKRYKKKVAQGQQVLFQVSNVLRFFLFARFKGHASRFWLCVDGNLLVCSLKGVCLLVLAECNVFVVLGTDYSRGPDALLQAQMSYRERSKNELIVGVMANLKLLPFKQTPLIQRRAHKLSLMLAGLVLVVERFGKVVFKLKPPYGVENQECLPHLLKKKLDNGEVAVAFAFSDTWTDETSLFTSELILVRKVKNCGSCEADDATWKEHKFFYSNSFISSLRSRMVFRGGVVDMSHF